MLMMMMVVVVLFKLYSLWCCVEGGRMILFFTFISAQHLKRLTFRGLLFRPRQLWLTLIIIITFIICTITDHQVGGCRQVGG